jgi:hypothetical protein
VAEEEQEVTDHSDDEDEDFYDDDGFGDVPDAVTGLPRNPS